MQSWKYMSRYFLQQNGTPPYRLILAELCLIVWPFEDSTRLVSKIRLEKYTRGYNPGSKSVPCVGRRIFPEAAEDEVPTPASMWQMKKPCWIVFFPPRRASARRWFLKLERGSQVRNCLMTLGPGKIKLTETLSRYSWLFFWEQVLWLCSVSQKMASKFLSEMHFSPMDGIWHGIWYLSNSFHESLQDFERRYPNHWTSTFGQMGLQGGPRLKMGRKYMGPQHGVIIYRRS